MLIPKTELNQDLENPTIPIKLANKTTKDKVTGQVEIKPPKIYISHINFIEPGNPEKSTQPTRTETAKLGFICIIPDTSVIFLLLYRLLIQSTKKKNKQLKKACVRLKRKPT